MANVVCSCMNCSSELGCFRNSWTGIGNSYFSPVHPPVTYINGFEPTGEVFAKGPDGSAVQNSVLQDLACRKCAKVVGLICNDAPAGHILKKNQLILRLAEMHVVSEQNGEKPTISVQQKIPLTTPGTAKKHPAVRRAATLQPTPRQQTPSTIVRDRAGSSASVTMQPPARDLSGKEAPRISAWAEDAIRSQQNDIDRISGTVSRIERDMASFKDFMTEVRAELEANRVTRKTQHESTKEQLVWLQEVLKELRQETGDFQQDMRGKEPDIRNQLDGLRQEIDSQDPTTEVPNNSRLPLSVDNFKVELMDIRRKAIEIGDLKQELRRLQNRLHDIEGKRQDSFVFPNTLRSSAQSSRQVGSRIAGMPKAHGKGPEMMLQAPEDLQIVPATTRQASPTQDPPGAFPNSLIDLTTHPEPMGLASSAGLSTRAQSRRVCGDEVAETAAPRPVKWTYTGIQQWQNLKVVFEAFGLEYPKLGIPSSIKTLEDHVNNSGLQSTAFALKYGEVELNSKDDNVAPSEANEAGQFRPKRKHDQLEATSSGSASSRLKKKSRQPVKMAESRKELAIPDQRLILPSPGTSKGPVALSLPPTHGSPELGRDSRLRSLGATPGHPGVTEEDRSFGTRHARAASIDAFRAPPTIPTQQNRTQPVHRLISRDELDSLPSLTNRSTPASRTKQSLSKAGANASKSLEDDKASIPGAFTRENDIVHADIITPGPGTTGAQSGVITGFDPRTDKQRKLYKCGPCGKRYRNPSALNYHKQHSSCNKDPSDETPTKFQCPLCHTELTYTGLDQHLAKGTCLDNKPNEEQETPSADKGQRRNYVPGSKKNNNQKRNEIMAAREKLVMETLAREM